MARFACMIGWAAAALALALGSVAHAGTTGSSDSGSSSDSSSAGSTTGDTGSTTGDTGSTTGSTGVDDTGSCGRCDPSPGTLTITSPPDQSMVDAPFPVDVVVTPTCNCDSCPCVETPPEYAQLFVDAVVWGAPCYELECTWEVTGTIGAHTVYARAVFGPDDDVGSTIIVHINDPMPGTDTGSASSESGPPPGTESSTGPGSTSENSDKGCGCATGPTPLGGAWLVALAAMVRRRRAG